MQIPRHIKPARRKSLVAAAGIVGIGGVLAGGSSLIASAATTETYENTASACSGLPVPAPATAVYEKTVHVGPNGNVSGTIPSPKTSTSALGVTAKSIRFSIRTQYESMGSTAKSGVMDVTVNNHAVYHNPVLFAIPPVDNSFPVGPDEALAYALNTHGAVASKVTIQEYVADATGTVVILGKTCPTGTTRTTYLQGNATASTGAPYLVTP